MRDSSRIQILNRNTVSGIAYGVPLIAHGVPRPGRETSPWCVKYAGAERPPLRMDAASGAARCVLDVWSLWARDTARRQKMKSSFD
ncbi:hypothetical protein EVAR_92704_1 [Eumeta japonica]|uniref:Uncharacterized protein n=1 Tax=Eumeta variegata TaxID=151549 RepID=A0A4C1SXX8_EUMVA|nr:hypothetical protein EVAR_92704_1 [Eumeta japonica]